MAEQQTFVVFFHPQALEVLGEAIKPYLSEGPAGPHVLCTDIDTGGALCEMTLQGKPINEKPSDVELMVPVGMIRLIVSVLNGEHEFGFA